MANLAALYEEDATQEEQIAAHQSLINTGDAWRFEGHVGRTAMGLIEAGQCMLGVRGHYDYYKNYVPSRTEVQAGTKGSRQYVVDRAGEEHAKFLESV